jgi:tRNA dimethylallyltransferase
MDIGTGKDLAEYAEGGTRVPCHLIDLAEPREVYSLFHYQRDFYRVFREVSLRGRLPVVVGGTGLYLEAVLRKFEVPDVPADEDFRREMDRRELSDLVRELEGRAPAIAVRTRLDCKRRVIRALEVARGEEAKGPAPVNRTDVEFRPLVLEVTWPPEELRGRIRARLDRRIRDGLVDEVRGLLGAGIPRERWNLFGMEYRHVAHHIEDGLPLSGMVRELAMDIDYLARRQRTYFRGMAKRGMEIYEVPCADAALARAIVTRQHLEPWRPTTGEGR